VGPGGLSQSNTFKGLSSPTPLRRSIEFQGVFLSLSHRFSTAVCVSALPPKADINRRGWRVRYGPCVDGSELARLFLRVQHWSVQPCVRPLSAVHMTAGHNALRGSGPDQKHAFDDALAHVGCPDRRIDRLCITCCSPSQLSHHTGHPARSRSSRESGWFLVAFTLGHDRPRHSCDLVGERDGRDLRWPPRQ
jgi:hypothetical protein